MLKINLRYGGMFSKEDTNKGIEVIVYNSEPQSDGTHISASSVFNAYMLKSLSKKKIDDLLMNLQSAIEACNKEVEKRMKLELEPKRN